MHHYCQNLLWYICHQSKILNVNDTDTTMTESKSEVMSKIKAGTKSKSRPDHDLCVESLESTAPVEKLIDRIQKTNYQAYKYYARVMGRRIKNIFGLHANLTGHTVNRFPERWDGQTSSDYYETFPYKSSLPVMISQIRHIGVPDPVLDLMKVKKEWSIALRSIINRKDVMFRKYEKISEDVVNCPKRLFDMAAHLENKPELNFDSHYNWYYTGKGNLHMLSANGIDYLLHSEFNCVYLSEFSKGDLKINYEKSINYDCGEGNNIFETVYSVDYIVALRTRYRVTILKIVFTDTEPLFEKLKEIECTLSYTSIAFDGYHKNILYVTNLDDTLKIINLDRMTGKTVPLKKSESMINNWSTVQYVDRTQYVHVNADSITMYDKRVNLRGIAWGDLNKFENIYCNKNTSVLPCDEKPYIYIGTYHNLFCLDMRSCSLTAPGILNRWTHCMQSPPVCIYKCDFERGRDLLCVNSQWCEDTNLIMNESTKMESYSLPTFAAIPYRPPSIRDTFREARLKMLCFDLYNPIDARIHSSVTGSLVVNNDDKYVIINQNSMGDISCHTLYPEYMRHFMEDDRGPELLHEWSKTYKLEKKDLIVSDIVNIEDLWSVLRKVPDDHKLFDVVKKPEKFSEDEILEIFKSNNLDTGLLEAWGVSVDDEDNDKDSSQSK